MLGVEAHVGFVAGRAQQAAHQRIARIERSERRDVVWTFGQIVIILRLRGARIVTATVTATVTASAAAGYVLEDLESAAVDQSQRIPEKQVQLVVGSLDFLFLAVHEVAPVSVRAEAVFEEGFAQLFFVVDVFDFGDQLFLAVRVPAAVAVGAEIGFHPAFAELSFVLRVSSLFLLHVYWIQGVFFHF